MKKLEDRHQLDLSVLDSSRKIYGAMCNITHILVCVWWLCVVLSLTSSFRAIFLPFHGDFLCSVTLLYPSIPLNRMYCCHMLKMLQVILCICVSFVSVLCVKPVKKLEDRHQLDLSVLDSSRKIYGAMCNDYAHIRMCVVVVHCI